MAGSGQWGYWGDDGPATNAAFASPAGVIVVPDGRGLMIFIADYYNGHVRAVGPDGIIRDVSDEGKVVFGAPTRVAYSKRRGWLYVTDSSKDQIVGVPIPRLAQTLLAPRSLRSPIPAPAPAQPKVGG